MSIPQQIINQIIATSFIEWISFSCGVLYVVLIAQKKISAWFFAIIGSCATIYLCLIANYYLETLLSVFYVIMGVWGWLNWNKKSNEAETKIIQWKLSYHIINIILSGLLTILIGYIFSVYTNQSQPYLDAFTTVFSLAATFMVTQKVLENWLYWIVIDIVSIQLYASKDYFMLAALMAFYSILAIYGYFNWKRGMKTEIAHV